MRKTLALLVASCLLAPGPSFAAALHETNAVQGVTLPAMPAAATIPQLSLPNAASAAGGLNAAAALPALPTAAAHAAAPAASAAAPAASARAAAQPQAAQQASARTEGAPATHATAVDTARSLAKAAPDASPTALTRAYDGSSAKTGVGSAPVLAKEVGPARRSGLARWTGRAAAAAVGAVTLFHSQIAVAMPDGYYEYHADRMQQAGQAGWAPLIVMGAMAGVAAIIYGIVKFVQWRDKKRWDKVEADIDAQYAGVNQNTAADGSILGLNTGTRAATKGGKNGPSSPTFADVAGQDEAKQELEEVVDFLKNPNEYKKLHPKYKGPKGVLLFGPPGTGKTLLARAVANEAGVTFVHRAGSDFINTYVGTGANNIREAFAEVRQKMGGKGGAGILFIDEIEAIGGARTGNTDRSEETRTINALLKEMDGFEKDNIIVIAATNMPDSLDPALLRGGRFGTKVPVGLPDVVGREAILKVHLKEAAVGPDVDYASLAKQTPGLAGADLEQVVMDAVKLAKRRKSEKIGQQDLIKAIDEFTIGKVRRLVMSEKERRTVAYHESGHAIVSHLLPHADPVRKVTIIPTGLGALGYMQAMSEEEKTLYGKKWLEDRIAVALGGRVAEEMMTGEVYSGAQNDLQQATKLARNMVMQFGMSDKIGHVSYDMPGMRPAVGGAMSEATNAAIDAEVKRIIDEQLQRVTKLLLEHRGAVQAMGDELMEKETLRSEDMTRIIAADKLQGKPPTAANENDPSAAGGKTGTDGK